MDPRLPEDRNDVFTSPNPRVQHVETGREARQGPLGRPILYVLIGGLVLAAIYLIATQIWSNTEPLPPAGQIEDAAPPAAEAVPPAAEPAPVTPVTPLPAPAPATPAP